MRFLIFSLILFPGVLTKLEAADSLKTVARPELKLQRSAEYDYDLPEPGTYLLPVIKTAGNGVVLGPNSKRLSLHELFRGRIVLLSFIYTRCTDPRACLRASGVLNELQRVSLKDPGIGTNLLLVTLSFDPSNDTPEVMGRYGRVYQLAEGGCEWLFLTPGSMAELQSLLESYGQRVDRRKQFSPLGPYNHTLRVYLIDRPCRIRNIYSYGFLDPRLVVTDVRTLMIEERK